jgi:hypothetical protein
VSSGSFASPPHCRSLGAPTQPRLNEIPLPASRRTIFPTLNRKKQNSAFLAVVTRLDLHFDISESLSKVTVPELLPPVDECSYWEAAKSCGRSGSSALSPPQTRKQSLYCTTEKVSCKVALESLPTQTSKSDGSRTQPFLAALQ